MANADPILLGAVVILALIGAWLVGQGMTGMVISQSCCFGPDCDPDYVCDPAHVERPAPVGGHAYLGVFLILGAVLLHKAFRHH